MAKTSHTVIVNFGCGQHIEPEMDELCQAELCPRNTMVNNITKTLITDRSQHRLKMTTSTVGPRDLGDKYVTV